MKKNIFLILILLLSMTYAKPARVVAKCDTTDTELTETANFEDDYIYLGKSLTFKGEAEDLIYLGQTLEFEGKTRLGIIAAGEDIRLKGSSGNGIIAGCEKIIIEGTVEGTSFIGSETAWIQEEATVSGDIFAGCGRLIIDAPVEGNIYAGAGKVTINNEIHGDVTVYGGRIVITPKGKINGKLKYSTKEKLTEEELTRITGKVTYEENDGFDTSFSMPQKVKAAFSFIIGFMLLVSLLIGGGLILFLPAFKSIETPNRVKSFGRIGLWGLIPIFMYPAVVLICLMLVVTIPIGLILILAFVPLFFVARVIGAVLVGQFISQKLNWNITNRHYHFLIGVAVYAILSTIPVVNFLTWFFYAGLGWGVYISFLFGIKKDTNVTEQITDQTHVNNTIQ